MKIGKAQRKPKFASDKQKKLIIIIEYEKLDAADAAFYSSTFSLDAVIQFKILTAGKITLSDYFVNIINILREKTNI